MKTFAVKNLALFLVFSIQLSVFAKGLSYSVEIPVVSNTEPLDGYIVKLKNAKLLVGEYKDYLEAMKTKVEITTALHVEGEVKAFFNYSEISLDEAFSIVNNRNGQDERIVNPLSEEEMERMLNSVKNHDFFYTVQVGVYSEKNVEAFYALPKTVDERITPKGYFRYTFGQFSTLQDAKDALRMIKNSGLTDAFVIAYDDMDRIPLSRAIEKEKQMLEDALAVK